MGADTGQDGLPARIGPYRPLEVLGEGAAGVVYRAVDAHGAEVALKVIRPEMTRDERSRSRLAHEIRALRELRHAHLVPLLDAGEVDGVSFIAFAFLAGSETLSSRLQSAGVLDPPAIVRLARQIGSALDAMHDAGLVHRDVKPSNVIMSGDEAQLSDLGLVRGAGYTALTRPGRVLGTADYLAPELIRGVTATPASDLYALGCALFECVVGTPPFGGRSMLAVGIAHLEEPPPDPSANRPELPPAFCAALLRALAKEPSERPPTALAYADMLEAGA